MLYALSVKTPFIGLLCSNNVSLIALLNDYWEVKLKHQICNLLKDLAHLTFIMLAKLFLLEQSNLV